MEGTGWRSTPRLRGKVNTVVAQDVEMASIITKA